MRLRSSVAAVDAADLLRTSTTIVLIDYPGTAVPAAIARAGYTTIAKEGPAPDDYCEHVVEGDEVAIRKVGSPPEHADIVYSHRPEDELPGIIDLAQQIGARAVWCETGSPTAREQVESAGLVYVDAPQIADAARANVKSA
jgi:predicted CoA-binding protein